MSFTVRFAYVDPHRVTDRVIFNPNYGGKPCTVPGSCIIPFRERKIKPKFFLALRKDVKENGFRNPILLYNTPEGLLLSFGGSRLRVAKELDKEVPAIIVDYRWEDSEFVSTEVVTEDNYQMYFRDVPVLFKITDVGVETHYSLERNRREWYDPAGMEWTKDVDDTEFLDEEFPWLR
jgi:hypothetical protein